MYKYTAKQIQFLKKNIEGRSFADLYKRFNRYFKLSLSQNALRSACSYYGLRLDPAYMKAHNYIPAEIRFLSKKVAGRSYAELTELFNRKFGHSFGVSRISGTLRKHGLSNGRDCRFGPGRIPPNKGKKGIIYPGTEKNWFKPGQMPSTYRPVGSERIDVYGYARVKVADPKKWKAKHVVIWEAANGKVPKGHAVIFADRNKQNFSLDNLLLVSRSELVRMNQLGLITADKELTKAERTIAKIKILIAERRRSAKKRRL